MRFKTLGFVVVLSLVPILQSCEPLSDHEREVRRIQKETKRLNKKLDKMKMYPSEKFIEDGRNEKAGIDEALRLRDWKQAKQLYELLGSKDIDLGTYPSDLEVRVLEIVTPLSGALYDENYLGYDFLSVINPDNPAYAQKAKSYKARLIKSAEISISKLKRKYDKVEGKAWYHHPNQPSRGVYLYIGQEKVGWPWLRLKGQYTSEYGWLFVNRITVWYDGVKEPLFTGPFERRNTSRIWEWQDTSPTAVQLDIMRSLANANESIIRFEGDKRNFDLTLNAKDRQVILDVLEAFEAMKTLQAFSKVESP